MRTLIVGGNGTIGKVLKANFKQKHEVISAGRTSGDVTVDIDDSQSIEKMYEQVGMLDSIICTAGEARWADFDKLGEEDYYIGIKSKLMGQVNLVRIGRNYLNANGSFTLSAGILADDPVAKTASASMVNGGLHSFVQAVALEMENGMRINVVSLGVVQDSYERYKDFFPGHNPVPMNKVVNAYVRSVEGWRNGEIIRVY